ncbi:hypothetical protein KFL_001080110 [Klebsormidium nitens]|uniref:Permease YjgP/YjgQ family protein n=1 Tax=Klebsormidium nitens TaxID=105231 RepID=A0A1Y1I0P2_KLENI|nr:hypothetical protein KFL_001080110 [Klebsormidium nitens]|eukprot:GAQ82336.1 hypothetical protein KFL_001080110 [Klebsormidium nitens]
MDSGRLGRGERKGERDKDTSAYLPKVAEKAGASLRLGGVLDKYILRSMLPGFVMALALCAFLGMSLGALVELIREVVSAGLPLRVAFGAALLQAPRFLSLALPLATLSGVLFGLGSLQERGELGALASAGVSNARLLMAPLLLATLAGLLTLGVNEVLIPVSSTRAHQLVETALTTDLHTLKARDDVIYHEYGPAAGRAGKQLQRVWYAQKLEGGRMERVTVLDCSPDGEVHRVLTAGSCAWDWAAKVWRFHDATLLHMDRTGESKSTLQMQSLSVPMPNVAKAAVRATADLHDQTRGEIQRVIERERKTGAECGPGSPAWKARWLLSQRDASVLTCAIYAMVGAMSTLSSSPRNSRSDPFKKAALLLLPYTLAAKGLSRLSQQGALAPSVGAWAPPAVTLIGIILWATLLERTS